MRRRPFISELGALVSRLSFCFRDPSMREKQTSGTIAKSIDLLYPRRLHKQLAQDVHPSIDLFWLVC